MAEKKRAERTTETQGPSRPRHTVRLPGFVSDDQIGLGDVIKRVTYRVGIQPCTGCLRRAARLNRWVGFERRR